MREITKHEWNELTLGFHRCCCTVETLNAELQKFPTLANLVLQHKQQEGQSPSCYVTLGGTALYWGTWETNAQKVFTFVQEVLKETTIYSTEY